METKQNSKLLVVGLIIALFLLVGQSYILTSDNNAEDNKVISVSGTSELSVIPDKAEIFISITTDNDDAKLAQSQNKEVSAKVIAALKEMGVNEKDIQTENFRLNENYVDIYLKPENGKPVIPKYEAVHTIKISTTNLEEIGNIVDTAVLAGANGIDYINFKLSDTLEAKVRADALEKAIVAGKAKAESMTKTLNVKLGEVSSINENNYYYTPYSYSANLKVTDNAAGASSELNYLYPQNVKVSSSVNLVFEIEE